MNILLSNDDGVYASGIIALHSALQELGDVTVIAPDRNRSGASNSLTLNRPLRLHRHSNGFYGVDGTPTDCVHLALTGFLDKPTDLVVSGLNNGANLGDDVLYSGTVAAAIEGRFLGLPALAFSMAGRESEIAHYTSGALIAKRLIEKMRPNMVSSQTILNVNIPDLPVERIRGFKITRLGTRHAAEKTVQTTDPRGQNIYWIGPSGMTADAGTGTDFHAVDEGYVSITPLTIDMTHYRVFDGLTQWIEEVSLI